MRQTQYVGAHFLPPLAWVPNLFPLIPQGCDGLLTLMKGPYMSSKTPLPSHFEHRSKSSWLDEVNRGPVIGASPQPSQNTPWWTATLGPLGLGLGFGFG